MERTVDEIKKLSPKSGDIIVIRSSEPVNNAAMAHCSALLRESGIETTLFVISDDSDMYILGEEMMAKFGWVKK